MKHRGVTRRGALALAAASPLARAQQLAGEAPGRIPPVEELLNASEFAAMAERKLDGLLFAEVKDSERKGFDRITFRPRLMVDSRQMDLTTELFGDKLFMPILIGPVAEQKRFHPEGELAMVRGAAAAKAILVVPQRASYPIDQIAAEAKAPFWYQVYLGSPVAEARAGVERAVSAGCKVLCVTVGADPQQSDTAVARAGIDWSALDRLRSGGKVAVVLKGVMSPEEAHAAVAAGAQGIVVSNYAARVPQGVASPIITLPAVADAVGGKAPILMDGGVRLGSDVLKALALGAQAVLLARPAIWGLAAYGAAGVQNVVELIQSEFARDMAMCGKVSIKALDHSVVRIHSR